MEIPRGNNLLFRQQFVMGPQFADGFEFWKKHEITQSLVISSHPDLNISHHSKNEKTLTLIGYIIDPNRPSHDNDEILNRLLLENTNFADLIRSTFELCGNWILIYKQYDDIFLFHDCTGVRSIFYTNVDKTKDLWFASQPRLIAFLLDLQEDKNAIDFMKSHKSKLPSGFRWPGDTSPYSEIKSLLPNNYFDLSKGEIYRYWPDRNLIKLQKNDAIEKISTRLKEIMIAATQRFNLALGLSSGLDSRVILSASKDIKDRICIYNGKRIEMSTKHPDILIPRRLTAKLKLDYHFIPSSNDIDDEFSIAYEMNAPYVTAQIKPCLQSQLKYFKQQKVAATGNILEIVRCYYQYRHGNDFSKHKPSGESLASYANMGGSQFEIDAFDSWLKSAKDVFNLNIYDIYGWEQGHGRWFSSAYLVFLTTWKEVFFPFNCRNLLIDFLSVPNVHRMPPDHTFFTDLMRNMWSDVLSEPINPKQKEGFFIRSKKRLKKGLKKIISRR